MKDAIIVTFCDSVGTDEEPDADNVHNLYIGLTPSDNNVHLKGLVEQLRDLALIPDDLHQDLLVFSIAVYTADVRIKRASGEDGWTREIELYVPVRDPKCWRRASQSLEHALRYLTGDLWTLHFSKGDSGFDLEAVDQSEFDVPHVALFSGGLDTFVGALDLVATGDPVILVGHYPDGSVSTPQREAYEHLQSRAEEGQELNLIQAWISPPGNLFEQGNDQFQRSRSLLFIALGLMVASAAGSASLQVAENGFVSLNVPLDDLRIGTYTTRTTHPRFLALMRAALDDLGITIELCNPYQFMTKGEMLDQCRDQKGLEDGTALTISCAHPTAGRFEGKGSKAIQNCGRCTACLIRRAAVLRALGDDPTEYRLDDLEATALRSDLAEGKDVRSARLAAQRVRENPSLADLLILKPGRLDGNYESFADLYRRGMDELWSLLADVDTTSARAS